MVDNGSLQPPGEFPESISVRVISNPVNAGFSRAVNQGFANAHGEYIFVLNSDVVLEPEYLEACVASMASDPRRAGVTGKLLKMAQPEIIDSTGHVATSARRFMDRGEWEPDRGQFDAEEEVFSIPATASLYRASALHALEIAHGEVFDEEMFSYGEDVDLSWRLRLLDWNLAFIPEASARHKRAVSVRGLPPPPNVARLDARNRYLCIIKNDRFSSLRRSSRALFAWEFRQTAGFVRRRPFVYLRVVGGFMLRLPGGLRKRRLIQGTRLVDWEKLERWFV